MGSNIRIGRIKPSFMIIGTQKAGTTSLHDYIAQHPNIVSPIKKELHFFDACKLGSTKEYHKNYPFGFFRNKISFESTPRYLYYPGTAKRLFEYNPNLKLIVVLRDPVQRAFSAWNMYRQMRDHGGLRRFFINNEKECPREQIHTHFMQEQYPDFSEWIQTEWQLMKEEPAIIEPSVIRRGYYKDQILEYLQYFDRDQFLFIEASELLKNPLGVLDGVFSFLGITPLDGGNLDLSLKNKREYVDKIDDASKELLYAHYREKNKGLENKVGLKLAWN